jgi:O-antigen/teichoic acid export membrane protein
LILVNAGAIRLLAIVLSYGVNVALLNIVSKETAGQYFLLVAWLSFIIVILVGGYSRYIVRELAKNDIIESSLREKISRYVGALALSAVLGGILLAESSLELSIALMSIPAIVYLALNSAILRGRGDLVLGNLEAQINRPIILLFLLYIGYTIYTDLSIAMLVIFYVASSGISLLLWLFFFQPKRKPKDGEPHNLDYKSIKELTIISLAELAFLQLDIIILGFLMGNEYLAEYKVALLIRMGLLIPQQAINMILPYFLSHGSPVNYQRYLKMTNLVVGLSGLVVNFLIGDLLIFQVFGDGYQGVSLYLYPYFFMMIFLGILGPALEVLIAQNKDQVVRRASIISLAINIILLVGFVPIYGVQAAVAAGAIAYSTFYFICFWHLHREMM